MKVAPRIRVQNQLARRLEWRLGLAREASRPHQRLVNNRAARIRVALDGGGATSKLAANIVAADFQRPLSKDKGLSETTGAAVE